MTLRPTHALCALSLALAACSPAAKPAANTLEGRAERAGAVRVIARLAPEPVGVATTYAAAVADLESLGVTGAQTITDSLPYVVADVTPSQLRAMTESARFDLVAEDRLSWLMLGESAPLVGAPVVWRLGGRGAGQAVAILDTGVDATHPFLAPRVTEEACFSTSSGATGAESLCPNGASTQSGAGAARPCRIEGCDHGTHVAGIAAGKGATFSGIAPDAEVIAVQVFSRFVDRPGGPTPCRDSGQRSPCLASFTSDQIRALEYVRQVAARRAVASANLSLGGGRSAAACDADFTKASIDLLATAGVATVIAAGNNGFADAVSYPGCVSSAVTVGATSKADQIAPFSNRGPVIDLFAPGVAINSATAEGRFAAYSGTSMAAPHVAGAFAALKSAQPGAGVADITRALISNGATVDRRPRLNLPPALEALRAATPVLAAASGETPMADIASLPADRVVRAMVRARTQPGADAAAVAAATQKLADAARAAGASSVEAMPGQPLVVMEAKPAVLQALVRAGAADAVQVDRPARPQ